MRLTLASLAVLAALVVPAAHADTFTMTFTPASGAASVFTLDTSKDYFLGVEDVFLNTPDVSNGVSSTFGRIDLLNTNVYSGFDLALCANGNGGGCPGGSDSWFSGAQLYHADGQLNVGTFDLSNGATVTIAEGIPAATPEPGSLALLGTGVLGFAGLMKRRLS